MSARVFRKTTSVEAMQFNGTDEAAADGISAFCPVGWFDGDVFMVPTLEGTLRATIGDWILKGGEGEFWPVRGDIFAKTYEPADRLRAVAITLQQQAVEPICSDDVNEALYPIIRRIADEWMNDPKQGEPSDLDLHGHIIYTDNKVTDYLVPDELLNALVAAGLLRTPQQQAVIDAALADCRAFVAIARTGHALMPGDEKWREMVRTMRNPDWARNPDCIDCGPDWDRPMHRVWDDNRTVADDAHERYALWAAARDSLAAVDALTAATPKEGE